MALSLLQKITLPFRRTLITPCVIGVRDSDGWLFIPKEEIAAIKAKSVSKIVVRLYDGRRFQFSLFRLPIWSYSEVMRALKSALQQNRKRRGLWKGAKDLPHIE